MAPCLGITIFRLRSTSALGLLLGDGGCLLVFDDVVIFLIHVGVVRLLLLWLAVLLFLEAGVDSGGDGSAHFLDLALESVTF